MVASAGSHQVLATALFASGSRDSGTFLMEFRFTLRAALLGEPRNREAARVQPEHPPRLRELRPDVPPPLDQVRHGGVADVDLVEAELVVAVGSCVGEVRQVARRQRDDHAVAVLGEHLHLREAGDLVDAGIGPGIRGEDHPGIERHGNAIGHGQ